MIWKPVRPLVLRVSTMKVVALETELALGKIALAPVNVKFDRDRDLLLQWTVAIWRHDVWRKGLQISIPQITQLYTRSK